VRYDAMMFRELKCTGTQTVKHGFMNSAPAQQPLLLP
jgi:hypothetical protein